MFKAYKRWNMFERRFFWINNTTIVLLMGLSTTSMLIPFMEEAHKWSIVIMLCVMYVIFRSYAWNRLEWMEGEWKRKYPNSSKLTNE